jgi:hypothetical protein
MLKVSYYKFKDFIIVRNRLEQETESDSNLTGNIYHLRLTEHASDLPIFSQSIRAVGNAAIRSPVSHHKRSLQDNFFNLVGSAKRI